jgi:hypothetical protein
MAGVTRLVTRLVGRVLAAFVAVVLALAGVAGQANPARAGAGPVDERSRADHHAQRPAGSKPTGPARSGRNAFS